MRRAPLLLILLALASEARPSDVPAPMLDASADRVLARTDVPDAARKVGEVRLVARGKAVVVQTLLATKMLPRVVAEIEQKEARNWPPDAAGRPDMERYMAAIRRTADRLRAERDEGSGDRRLHMLIELVATPDAGALVVGGYDGEARAPSERKVFESAMLGTSYVSPNMRLILADAFHMPETDVDRLGPLGPIARP